MSTPESIQKLQMALHAKAKAEPGFRFYILYDKISREDILAHAYAQCRSNKGAPGVDGQDVAEVEAYGVERWLGELALALRKETYRPDPIRRVFIPKVNGKLRPLGISTLRDRVCMTAAMLVLDPISNMNTSAQKALSKVPEVTLVFWIIKIAATTLGETGGDAVTAPLARVVGRRARAPDCSTQNRNKDGEDSHVAIAFNCGGCVLHGICPLTGIVRID